MKKIAIIMILAAFVASCGNGGSKKKGDGPVMVEMNGTWKGILPAADGSISLITLINSVSIGSRLIGDFHKG